MVRESAIESYAVRYFREQGWLCYKTDLGGGFYDHLFISPKAFHLYVEFKPPNKIKLSAAQEMWATMMHERIWAGNKPYNVALRGPINNRTEVRMLYSLYRNY